MASNIYRHIRFGTVLTSWIIFHSEETMSPLSKGQIVVLWAQQELSAQIPARTILGMLRTIEHSRVADEPCIPAEVHGAIS